MKHRPSLNPLGGYLKVTRDEAPVGMAHLLLDRIANLDHGNPLTSTGSASDAPLYSAIVWLKAFGSEDKRCMQPCTLLVAKVRVAPVWCQIGSAALSGENMRLTAASESRTLLSNPGAPRAHAGPAMVPSAGIAGWNL